MTTRGNKSAVLKHIGGEGPIDVMTRLIDFNIQEMDTPDGRKVEVPANTLVTFTAQRFREIVDGEWEFETLVPAPDGQSKVRAFVYISADDIFLIRRHSKVI